LIGVQKQAVRHLLLLQLLNIQFLYFNGLLAATRSADAKVYASFKVATEV
jgi:hypothetical protein